VALEPLLAELPANGGVSLHEDTRLGAGDAGVEASVGADHVAVGVQGCGVLTEVPDVATGVLRVVVTGPFLQDVVQVERSSTTRVVTLSMTRVREVVTARLSAALPCLTPV